MTYTTSNGMENNKLLGVLLVLAVASSLYWMNQFRQLSDRFFVLRESFSYNNEDITNDGTSGGIQVGLFESEASQCFYVDFSIVDRTLKRGLQGEDVRAVQMFLVNEYAMDSNEIVTGYFGPSTEQWVKELQLDKNLIQTGVIDSETLMAMEEEQVASCAR